ncbi:hypothetical protein KEM55_000143 [Ascosphaera atra]|nr:hypothetical protein KEM55_000143 [Ascosphaera atra]
MDQVPAAARARLINYSSTDEQDVTARLLSAFIDYLPSDGRHTLYSDILSCENDQEIKALALHLEEALLLPLKAAGGQTPAVLTPSPVEGFEQSVENLEAQELGSVTRGRLATLREQCLARDGRRCVISQIVQYDRSMAGTEAMTAPLGVSHILPSSLGNCRIEEGRHRLSTVWDTLYRCFPALERIAFVRQNIDDPENALTLFPPLHCEFGRFRLCLEETNTPNVYRVKTFCIAGACLRDLPDDGVVRLVSHDDRVPLPNPELLKVHAAIANILHASGRGLEYDSFLDKYPDSESGNSSVLAPDGSSDVAKMLAASRLPFIAQPTP